MSNDDELDGDSWRQIVLGWRQAGPGVMTRGTTHWRTRAKCVKISLLLGKG